MTHYLRHPVSVCALGALLTLSVAPRAVGQECSIDAECDDGSSCTADACVAGVCQSTIEPAGTVCRPSAGPCDPMETCDGLFPTCPFDVLEPAGTECRASIGPCDIAETCDGFSSMCPADVVVPDGTACDDGAFCTLTDACVSGVCVGSGDPCSGQSCDEISDTCFDCSSDGECDDGRLCTVDACVAGVCEHTVEQTGTVCRTSTGPCDPEETCDGLFATCPPDVFVADGTACDDGAFCTLTDVCISGVCVGSGNPCSGQACDEVNDTCFECSIDVDCDDRSLCTADACVAGVCESTVEPAGTVCRTSTGPCDPEETCDGLFATCPADVFAADGTACDDGAFCTLTDLCTSGVCAGSGDPCPGQDCDETNDTCVGCLSRGSACSVDNECCSGKCRGRTGRKTCKGG